MLLEQHIAARAGILLLEQHLNAARAAFFSARAEVKVSTPLVRHSGYAKHEVAEAMDINISEGYSIIPLLIEPCTVPDFLKNITYIDATHVDVNEMQRRVLETVANHITGMSVDCALKKLKENWKFRFLQHYQLLFDERDRERITESGLQITDDELAELETTSSVICVGVGRSEGAIRLHRSGYTNLVKRPVGPVNKLSYTHSSLIVALSHV
ncbi:hypothetical protein DPMN_004805 [Dreissena polymorpha]|uniref:Uncharacterized protein n=1 Tax=Dreissena polymorpha TaxID=45954 RepID=A0A9D4MQW1_DREPO|nr:hypothetical protein DPMN_004805 [Dreissena polymorpha]